ncbi:MAG: TetR/AcrR family transcriptional regulator [Actinomycetota bacterium]|nr:TetR/AcrR family transcriptional regulator [Actinomycetota bacterium]
MAPLSTPSPTAARITEAILAIIAEQGLEHATVREVAAVAGVSIGTVQHHFPTKDAMLAGAFTDVVRQVRARLEALQFGHDAHHNTVAVLEEILPLDQRRRREGRVQLAFAVRAMHEPTLAATQREVLGDLHGALRMAFAATGPGDPGRATLAAHAALAVADGLALHALSTVDWLTPHDVHAAVDLIVVSLTAESGAIPPGRTSAGR